MMRSDLIIASIIVVATSVSFTVESKQQCGVPSTVTNYILRGDETAPLEFPWQVSLQMKVASQWYHFCGASIIDKNWILTAAHCVDPRQNPPYGPMRALLGAHNVTRLEELASSHLIDRNNVIMHPMWNFPTLDYDYALIQLPKPLDFAGNHSHLRAICLPQTDEIFEKTDCVASGWGLTENSKDIGDTSDVLQKVAVRVTSHNDCVQTYLDDGHPYGGGPFHVTTRHICAVSKFGEGSGPCSGDSGGPLQCNVSGRYVLAGVTSFGKKFGSLKYPLVYACVTEVLPWIEGIMANKTTR